MNIMKRLAALALALMIVLSALPVSAFAETTCDCPEGSHVEGCPLYCTMLDGCTAVDHNEGCLSQIEPCAECQQKVNHAENCPTQIVCDVCGVKGDHAENCSTQVVCEVCGVKGDHADDCSTLNPNGNGNGGGEDPDDGISQVNDGGETDPPVVTDPVAKIGEFGYATIQEALDVGGTVTLQRDTALTDGLEIAAGKTVILDLNGKTLSYISSETTGNAAITNNGTLTITGGGTVTYSSSAPSAAYAYSTNTITNRGTMTVVNGTIENKTSGGSSNAIDSNSTTGNVSLTIQGGTFTTGGTCIRLYVNSSSYSSTLNISGGAIAGAYAVQAHVASGTAPDVDISISGGSLTSTHATKNYALYCWTDKASYQNVSIGITGGDFNGTLSVVNLGSYTAIPSISSNIQLKLAQSEQYEWNTGGKLIKKIASDVENAANKADGDNIISIKNDGAATSTAVSKEILADINTVNNQGTAESAENTEVQLSIPVPAVGAVVTFDAAATSNIAEAAAATGVTLTVTESATVPEGEDVAFDISLTYGTNKVTFDADNGSVTVTLPLPASMQGEDKKIIVTYWENSVAIDSNYPVSVDHTAQTFSFTTSHFSNFTGRTVSTSTTWDGTSVDTSWANAEPYIIDSAADLAGLAELVNGGTTFSGKTITLAADIDLSSKPWPGIGVYKDSSKSFQGTFDGGNHTVSNMTFSDASNGAPKSEANNYRGFFNQIDNAIVTRLTVSGDVWATAPKSEEYGGALIVGCANNSTISHCTAKGSANATHNAAGIVVRIKNSHIKNCTNDADITGSYTKLGGIVALSQGSTNAVIDNCVNTGTIQSTDKGTDGVGGIIGWIGYSSGSEIDLITVSNCTNTGTVTGTSTAKVGQIAGVSRHRLNTFTGNKGLSTIPAIGHTQNGLNYATVSTVDGKAVATYVTDDALAAGGTYLVTGKNPTPTVVLAAGESITFDQTLAVIDPSGINGGKFTETPDKDNAKLVTYTPHTYKIEFQANGGTGTMAAQEITYNQKLALTANAFQKTGYTFTGWNTAADGKGTAYAAGANVNGKTLADAMTGVQNGQTVLTLYAQWEVGTYTITFDTDGGTPETIDAIEADFDTDITKPADPTKEHYTFAGWMDKNSNSTDVVTFPERMPGQDLNLKAKWTPVSYSITYAGMEGATLGTGVTNPASYTIETPTFTLNNPTKPGYTFAGWEKGNDEATTTATVTVGTTGDLTFTATWTANTYKIEFDANGGSGTAIEPILNVGYNVEQALPENTFTKTGHTFAGWSKSATATTGTYADEATVKELTTENNATVTLYAVWTPITYTIAFDANDGSGTMTSITNVKYGESKTLPENTFTKTGKNFAGWAKTATATEAEYTNKASVSNLTTTNGATVTLYAVWSNYPALEPTIEKQTLTYNGLVQSYILKNVPSDHNLVIEYEQDGEPATPKNAGTYDVIIKTRAATARSGNYATYPTTKITGGLTIEKAKLTVTYQNETIYKDETAKNVILISGFVNGETPDTVTGFEYPYVIRKYSVGTHVMKPEGGKPGDNYYFDYVAGTLIIKEKIPYVYSPDKLLQTGATTWPIAVLTFAGIGILAAGMWLQKKKESHET